METRGSSFPDGRKIQIQEKWIPGTPLKPIAPKPAPIYADGLDNQLEDVDWAGPPGFSHRHPPGFERCVESSTSNHNWEDQLERRTLASHGTGTSWNPVAAPGAAAAAGYRNLSFRDQLALAEASSAVSTSGMSVPFVSGFSCQIESGRLQPKSSSLLLGKQGLQFQPDIQLQNNYMQKIDQYGHSAPCGLSYDLNLLPSTFADGVSSGTVCTIAPATPDKSKGAGNEEVLKIRNDCLSGQFDERNKDGFGSTRVNVDEWNCDKGLSQPITGSSPAALAMQLEDHNPDKGGSQAIDLNKTPQQQKQRRKKHRPKVITERKPRTPKPKTPNPTGSKENPTGKRKYVRRNTQNKSPATPAKETEVIADAKTAEPIRRSCRKALDFNLECQTPHKSNLNGSVLNLSSESQAQKLCMKSSLEKSQVRIDQGTEIAVEMTEAGIPHELNYSINHKGKDYKPLPETQTSGSPPKQIDSPYEQIRVDAPNESSTENHAQATNKNSTSHVLDAEIQIGPRSPNDSNCSTSESPTEEKQERGAKRGHSQTVYQAQLTPMNLMGAHYSSMLENGTGIYTNDCVFFPGISKKKRTEKVTYPSTPDVPPSVARGRMVTKQATSCQQNDCSANPAALNDNCWISEPKLNASGVSDFLSKESLEKMPFFQGMLNPGQPDKLTKKRTRGHTRVRDLSSLNGFFNYKEPALPAKQAPTNDAPHSCIDALLAESRSLFTRKKRTKKRDLYSVSSGVTIDQMQEVNAGYGNLQFSNKTTGSLKAVQKKMISMDTLVEQLRNLNINNRIAFHNQHALIPFNMQHQDQNALVLYGGDGMIIPFEGPFSPIRKHRPRPKVDLDEETTRVWQLLMANINSEGIDGTDEEKAKWWEEERRVFHGRADSFIARMRLVQGDRRFSRWKGSVVDSVVGVFLTQNVSDHLSSSAFMSLAARFPLKSKNIHEGTSVLIKDPEVYVLDPEDTVESNDKISSQPVSDRTSVTPYNLESCEDKEVVNSNESLESFSGGVVSMNNSKCKSSDSCECATETNAESSLYASSCQVRERLTSFIEDLGPAEDGILSQTSVVSSQNSTDSSVSLIAERMGSCSGSNSEAEEQTTWSKLSQFDGSNSFMELLRLAGPIMMPEVHSQGYNNMSSYNNLGDEYNRQRSDDPKSIGLSIIPPSKFISSSETLEFGCLNMLEGDRSHNILTKQHENGAFERINLTEESTGQATVKEMMTVNTDHETERGSISESQNKQIGVKGKGVESLVSTVIEERQQNHLLPNSSAESAVGTQSTGLLDKTKSTESPAAQSNTTQFNFSSNDSLDVMKTKTSSTKNGKVRKAQGKGYNWDNLRKEVQANGKKERTTNTQDSLDWEAVRSADVSEIANTIKERGMNNMLAERIKAFLNRLVAEHGSIDLEWLRDVPPDKAKEYLLSIRGLGLKSVECVRLLTLHHLAFPVDTNVGRIAVRLGWVPLQPLPESLQLHLLELYPVLESIQKYLWPRLCKLDQRTLYELHYQMITFGKVFCTKSKPNCNACPMRGECRHFASAFASARLALPGPEEKSLVSTTENGEKDQGPANPINLMSLPLPQVNLRAESKSLSRICEPIIEEPATPEPECTAKVECDIEDTFCEDPNEIPTIKLNIEEFTQNLQNYMQKNMELQEAEMSKALVALTPEAASIPMPKLKNVNRLRTEHQVYELPDSHPLLEGLDEREPDDPCSYLLAIWTPGETANSFQPPEIRCNSQESGRLCDQETCFSCNSIREANSQTVRGTLLIPCRTAMRGSFPLNGTYFQVNEVFADHDSSLTPLDIPRSLIWNLPRRTVYFGTSIPTIFKGLSTEGIQHCFWKGYVCVRGFDQKTRAPRPLMARLHFPASKLIKRKGQTNDE